MPKPKTVLDVKKGDHVRRSELLLVYSGKYRINILVDDYPYFQVVAGWVLQKRSSGWKNVKTYKSSSSAEKALAKASLE